MNPKSPHVSDVIFDPTFPSFPHAPPQISFVRTQLVLSAPTGVVFAAIQTSEANDRDVLVLWNSWRHEFYKPMGTLHDADRGGFIFAPEVGLHEDVHELDFSSLYPNIICTRNVSPDVIRCECHRDRGDVPGLGYSICDEQGYLVDVLQPIIDTRDEIKAAIRREHSKTSPIKSDSKSLKDGQVP